MDPRRRLLLDLLEAALGRVNGRSAVRTALAARTDVGPVHLAAVGKAAASMALGAHDALGRRTRFPMTARSQPVSACCGGWTSFPRASGR